MPDAALETEPERRDCLRRLLADFPEHHAAADVWAREAHGLGARQLLELVFSVCVLGNSVAEALAPLRREPTAR